VNPGRAIAVEVPDQIRILTQFSAMGPGYVITPLFPFRTEEVVVASVLFPLVRFHERQQMAIGHIERPVLSMWFTPRGRPHSLVLPEPGALLQWPAVRESYLAEEVSSSVVLIGAQNLRRCTGAAETERPTRASLGRPLKSPIYSVLRVT